MEKYIEITLDEKDIEKAIKLWIEKTKGYKVDVVELGHCYNSGVQYFAEIGAKSSNFEF